MLAYIEPYHLLGFSHYTNDWLPTHLMKEETRVTSLSKRAWLNYMKKTHIEAIFRNFVKTCGHHKNMVLAD